MKRGKQKLSIVSRFPTLNIGKFFALVRLKILELRYLPHVEVRLVHDKTYARGGAYKKWTDSKYSSAVHKAVLVSFIISFVVFSIMQNIFPLLDLGHPNVAQAGSTNVTWTTKGDFENNTAALDGATIKSNIVTSGSTATDDSTVSLINSTSISQEVNVDTTAIATSSVNDYAQDSVISDGYLYVVGPGYSSNDSVWRIEKRSLTDLSLVTSFDSDGVVEYNPQNTYSGDEAQAVAADNTYLYVAGKYTVSGYSAMRVLRINKTTGASGVLFSYHPSTSNNDEIRDIALDGLGYLYVIEKIANGASYKIEKRSISNGALSATFNSGGEQLQYDSGYLYIYGYATNTVKKISATTGTIETAFSGDGYIGGDGSSYSGLAIDEIYIYVAHDNKLDKYNKITGAIVDGFTPVVASNANYIIGRVVKEGGYLYTGGIDFNVTGGQWFLEKRSATTGALDEGFGTNGTLLKDYTSIIDSLNSISVSNGAVYAVGGRATTTGAYNDSWQIDLLRPNYSSPGTISDLRLDSTAKAKWSALSWNSAALPANATISFKARTSDDNSTWSGWSSDITQDVDGATTGTGSLSALTASRYLDIVMTLTSSDGLNPPTLNDFTVTYDTLEAPTNSNLILTKTDGSSLKDSSGATITGGVAEGYTNESTLRVTANSLTCTSCSTAPTNLRPEVEIKPVGSAFTGTTNLYAATAGNTYVDIPSLVDGTSYHLQVRAIDDQGRVSGWTAYGANAESSADISIDQVAPTGTVSINAGAEFATSTTVNLTLSASDTGGSTLGQMRFSNDGTTWSDWEAYATSKNGWTLTEGDGAKTVYAQFKDDAGNVSGESYLEQDAIADTYIDEATPSTNLGSNALIMVGNSVGSRRRGILRFDISTIPQGATISSASLNLYASYTNGRTINIHNLSVSDWVASQTTWSEKSTGVPWSSVGGDFDVSPLVSDGTNRTNSYVSYNIKSLAEASYLDSSQYLDMLLKTDVENITSSMTFHALENVSGYDPYIRINYSYNSASDTITLDTTPPADVTNLKVYSDSGKSTEYTTSTWHTNASPYFEWDAATGASGYKYCFTTSASCTPSTVLEATNYTANLSTDGNYYFRVRAYDVATNKSTAITTFNYGYDATAPAAITGLSAPLNQATSSSIKVLWDGVSDTGSGIAGYTLEYKLFDDLNWVAAQAGANCNLTSGTSCVISGLQGGYAYQIRLKATNNAGLETGYESVTGYTVDTLAPSDPDINTVTTCDGTLDNCSDIDNKGYENKITWTASNDTGVGVTGYKIYRRAETNSITSTDFDLVGYFDVETPGATGLSLVYFDNDANNDATFDDITRGTVKIAATAHLNDYTTYYYRLTAIDESGNETDVVPISPLEGPLNTNYATVRTLDVTNPSVPADLNATATGIDDQNNDPLTQGVSVSWSASIDARTTGRVPEGLGSGIKQYELYRATGDLDAPTEEYVKIYTGALAGYEDNSLADDTYYYYKVKAIDNSNNTSSLSGQRQVRTKNSQVPTTPSLVSVNAVTGDPNSNPDVGTKIEVSFTGSKIKVAENELRGYRVYRSTTNFGTDLEWTSLTPVYTFADLGVAGEVQDGTRSFTDTVPTDATTYYYRVIAYGYNASNAENVESSPSTVIPGTLHRGWDIAPDATAPEQPSEVTVKDIHGNSSLYRNIVTWQMIATSNRNGSSDFAKYQVYRYETNAGVGTATLIAEKTDIGDNYHVDGIASGASNIDYSYYVVALDNAATAFKYANGTIINAYSNSSGYSGTVAINPAVAKPTVSGAASSNVGVSTATIVWNTNQPCDSLVEYKVKDSATVIAAGKDRTTPITSHSVALVGLEKGKTYQYRIISRNSLGNIDVTAATTWQEFSTQDFSISSAAVVPTTTTATVSWKTNIAADSSVEYKPESSSESSNTAGDPTLGTNHEVIIKGLKPATTYTYKIRSVSADNYITDTSFATFTTKPYDSSQFTIAPNASNIAEQNITATSAKIVWNTAIETDTWVDFGTEAGNYTQSAGDETLNTVHVVELKNLSPGTTYYYRVRGKDLNLVEYTSKEYSFTAVLKPEIQNIKLNLLDSYTAKITFATNVDTEASVTYGQGGNFDLKAGTSEFKRNHEITLENLDDAAAYSYYIEVKDKIGNAQKSAVATFSTPLDREGPKVSDLKIDILPMGESDEFASVIVSWNTNKPATTKVEYDEGVISGKYGKSTIEDTSLNTSHTVIIKDLNPSTTYHFRIAGHDKRDNKTNSQDYTFVTPEKNKSVWQLIVRSLEETFSWVSNVGGFFRGLGSKL